MLLRRPRLVNLLHACGISSAQSQTIECELRMLADYARAASLAVEIGSFQGVSAVAIASAMKEGGTLFCVDPWPGTGSRRDPSLKIFEREIVRHRLQDKIRMLRGRSCDVASAIPEAVDFIFVNGDHSLRGISFDWSLVKARLLRGGFACLHDVYVPKDEAWRQLDSARFFSECIVDDPDFHVVDRVAGVGLDKHRPMWPLHKSAERITSRRGLVSRTVSPYGRPSNRRCHHRCLGGWRKHRLRQGDHDASACSRPSACGLASGLHH